MVFESDSELDGLVLRMKSPSMAVFFQFSDIDIKSMTPSSMRVIFEPMAEHMLSWDMEEEDGTPVPCNLQGLLSLEMLHVLEIMTGWIDAAASVSVPLGQPASSGSPSLEASIQMEPLSENRAS